MSNVADIFDEQNGASFVRRLQPAARGQGSRQAPWGVTDEGELPPMMFQLWLADGAMVSFPYSAIGELRCRDAGRIEVYLHAIAKTVVTVEGRHLRELAQRLSAASVIWLRESDPRELGVPEHAPEIVKVTIEELPD